MFNWYLCCSVDVAPVITDRNSHVTLISTERAVLGHSSFSSYGKKTNGTISNRGHATEQQLGEMEASFTFSFSLKPISVQRRGH